MSDEHFELALDKIAGRADEDNWDTTMIRKTVRDVYEETLALAGNNSTLYQQRRIEELEKRIKDLEKEITNEDV